MEALLPHASWAQTLCALAAYLLVVLWERWRPWLHYGPEALQRWGGNFGLLLVNHALPYLAVPLTAAAAAGAAAMVGGGLLQRWGVPGWLMLPAALLALDLNGWLVHRAMHHHRLLWRLHQVHHSDLQFDASLGFRFHPGEALLMALTGALVAALLGLMPAAVLASGLITIVHNLFAHANARLGPVAETLARQLVVTPDLHRLHHSLDEADAMHNFGIVFPWWDRLFGSYRDAPAAGTSSFGLATERDAARLSLPRLLLLPFLRPR